MKFAIALVAFLGVASAQQITPDGRVLPTALPLPAVERTVINNEASAQTVRSENDIAPDGNFVYGFETNNGIVVQVQGVPRNFGGNPPIIPDVFQGAYGYTSPEGKVVLVSYTADENGFHPQGDSIPTPPPIPEYILRSLEFNARNAPPPSPTSSIQKK